MTWKFPFNGVYPMNTTQEEIFKEIAEPVIDSCMEGYNGTIFAYGQTGSGKTFTITGGAERYVDRGIIPRTISYLFQK
jgi:kinesin family member 6/9